MSAYQVQIQSFYDVPEGKANSAEEAIAVVLADKANFPPTKSSVSSSEVKPVQTSSPKPQTVTGATAATTTITP